MVVSRSEEAALSRQDAPRGAVLVVAAVLIALVFAPSFASALPLKEAAGSVKSVVPPVPKPHVPSPPAGPPPKAPAATAPRPPVHVPAAPQPPAKVPAVPQAPAKAPSKPHVPAGKAPSAPATPPTKVPSAPHAPAAKAPGTTPKSPHVVPAPSGGSSKTSSPGINSPSAKEITNGTRGPAGVATSAVEAGAQETSASAPSGVDGGSGSHSVTSLGSGAGSLQTATIAPLPRLLAYVWPAIALGPAGNLLAALQARFDAALPLPVSVSDVSRLLSGLGGPNGVVGAAGTSSNVGLSSNSVISSSPSPNPRGTWVPDGATISLFVLIAACAALMALLAFAIRHELHSPMHRRPF